VFFHEDGDAPASALLRRMLAAGMSRWHPDPLPLASLEPDIRRATVEQRQHGGARAATGRALRSVCHTRQSELLSVFLGARCNPAPKKEN
jgi:hypothetical protein